MAGASLMAPSSASADNKKSSKKAPKTHVYKKGKVTKAKAKTTSVAKSTKSRTMIFDGDSLDAERFSPGGFELTAAKRAKYGSLIQLRSHFVSEILKSADDL